MSNSATWSAAAARSGVFKRAEVLMHTRQYERINDDILEKSDDDIFHWLSPKVFSAAGGDQGLHFQRQAMAGLTVLSLRSQKALRDSIIAFNKSNDEYSKKLVRLTWALIGLTIVLGLLAVPPAVEVMSSHLVKRPASVHQQPEPQNLPLPKNGEAK